MEKEKWLRKRIRLPDFNYAQPNSYFITICTKERIPVFWESVAADIIRQNAPILSVAGQLVDVAISQIHQVYPSIIIDKYCIMPDHIHIILRIEADAYGYQQADVTISRAVGQMKRWVTKKLGRAVWQKSFIDRVIRNEQEYLTIWEYIENNPVKLCSGG